MNIPRLRHDVAVVSQRWDQLPRILKPPIVVVLGCVAAASVYKEWRIGRSTHKPIAQAQIDHPSLPAAEEQV